MTPSPEASGHPDAATAVIRIALQVGATPIAHVDVGTVLSAVCAELPAALGVAGAALVLREPADPRDPQARHVFASDELAARLALIQHRAGRGPVPAAARGERPLVVPDMTVSGPPELAADAADCGLVRSLVVPIAVAGQPAGGLQLLATADTALDEGTAAVLWPVVAALSARLADVREIARLQMPVAAPTPPEPEPAPEPAPELTPAEASPEATTALTAVTPPADAQTPDEEAPEEPGTAAEETAAPTPTVQATIRLAAVAERSEGHPSAARATQSTPVPAALFDSEESLDTPPIGQAELGWEGADPTPRPTPLPVRPLPARVQVVGRRPRPAPAAVPAQRSGSNGADAPTWRVPRHRLRED